MREDCLRAQEAVSRAADGDPVAAEEAAWAKHHCAECTECTAYVRTLAQLQTVPTPHAPEETIARIIAQGTALIEADRQAAEESRTRQSSAESSAQDASARVGPVETAVSPDGTFQPVASVPRRRSTMSTIGIAAGVAAVLFAAMIVTAQGLRAINNPKSAESTQDTATRYSSIQEDTENQQDPEAATETMGATTASRAPGYVVFHDIVYRFTSIVDETVDDLTRVGTLRTALDTEGTPQQRTVYEADSQDRLFIEANGVYAFTPVTREFEGAVFVMHSKPIEAFGEWPTLPSGVPEPTQPDGSPVFKIAGQSNNVSIYTRTGRGAEDGFAVAPNTPANDPAGGNPGWTWWEPQD